MARMRRGRTPMLHNNELWLKWAHISTFGKCYNADIISGIKVINQHLIFVQKSIPIFMFTYSRSLIYTKKYKHKYGDKSFHIFQKWIPSG